MRSYRRCTATRKWFHRTTTTYSEELIVKPTIFLWVESEENGTQTPYSKLEKDREIARCELLWREKCAPHVNEFFGLLQSGSASARRGAELLAQ